MKRIVSVLAAPALLLAVACGGPSGSNGNGATRVRAVGPSVAAKTWSRTHWRVIGSTTTTTAPATTTTSTVPVATTTTAPPTTTTTPPATTSTTAPAANPFVAACGTNLCRNGSVWRLYGASVLSGLDSPSATVSAAVAARLNTVRVVNFLDEHGAPASAPYDAARWQRVDAMVAAARSAGLGVVLDLSTYRNMLVSAGINPYTYDWNPFVQWVANRVNWVTGIAYKNDPTIVLVALAGEVEPPNASNNVLGVTTDQISSFFRRTFSEWKAIDANHLLSSGGLLQLDWNSGIDWKTIFSSPGSDVCSIHNYSTADSQITTPAVAAYCASIGKPWITEEFGWDASIGDSVRATDFQAMFDLQRTYKSAGVAFWNLGAQTATPTYDVNANTPLTYAVVQRNTGLAAV